MSRCIGIQRIAVKRVGQGDKMRNDVTGRDKTSPRHRVLKYVIAGGKHSFIVGLAMAIVPICAHAQNAQPPMSLPLAVKAVTSPSYGYVAPSVPFVSWLAMVSAS